MASPRLREKFAYIFQDRGRISGGRLAGDYHTHGAYDPGYDNESFSPDDKDSNDAEGTAGLPGYLGTPRGAIKVYVGSRAHPRQGAIIRLVPPSTKEKEIPCYCD